VKQHITYEKEIAGVVKEEEPGLCNFGSIITSSPLNPYLLEDDRPEGPWRLKCGIMGFNDKENKNPNL